MHPHMSGKFLWGVSTSGYQSEGGFNGDGEPQNNWAAAERDGRAQRTGSASEFWTRYESDFALARSMGCEGAQADSAAALSRLLASRRPKDRPLVIGATIDPAQYTQQF